MAPDSRLLTTAGLSLLLHVAALAGAAVGHEAVPALPTFTPITVTLTGSPAPRARTRVASESTQRTPAPAIDRTALAGTSVAAGVEDPPAFVEARSDVASLNNPAPPYPLAARRRGMEGRVVLDVQVSADGRCAQARIRESSGYALLDESAVQTMRRWRFVPASRAGLAVDSRVEVPVVFRLQGHSTTASR